MVALQNVLARSKKQEAQNVDREQAPAEGQAGATQRCRRVGQDYWVYALCSGLCHVTDQNGQDYPKASVRP
jgi:hypothetical protein